jgi:hypothetical protein
VAEDEAVLRLKPADAAVEVIMDIGGANPDRIDLYRHFTRAGMRDFNLLQPEVAHPVKPGRSHSAGAAGTPPSKVA